MKVIFCLSLILLVAGTSYPSLSGGIGVSRSRSEIASRAFTSVPTTSFTDAEFDRHVSALRRRLPANEFSIFIQPPFVVIGNEPSPIVAEHARETVRWAVERLKQDFFTKDPRDILDIWLFKDATSYERYAGRLFGVKPTTPFGYYSSVDKALIMNIATGGGTLVHELVHPFVEANFPACPAWFNEGLGSLYEQSGEVDGHIHGFVNWRLPGLQRAIKAGSVPDFKTFTTMDSPAFYGDTRGTNYAQARYLCHYLQEQGLLVRFYHEFLTHHTEDPTGYDTLQAVLGEPDMKSFKIKWEQYVLNLKQG